MSYIALDEMFVRQLCKMSSRFAILRSLRRLKGIWKRSFQGVLYNCLKNHLVKASRNCLFKMLFVPLYEMSFRQLCKISSRFANPTSFKRLKDILPKCLECLHETSLRCLFTGWALSRSSQVTISKNWNTNGNMWLYPMCAWRL